MNGAMWSLSVEFQFYATVAFLFLMLRPLRLSQQRKEQALFAAAAIFYLFCFASRLALHFTGRPLSPSYLVTWNFDFLALGVMLAYVPSGYANLIWRWLGRATPFVLLAPALIIPAAGHSPLVPHNGPDWLMGIGFIILGLTFAALVLAATSPSNPFPLPGFIRRFGNYVGDRSYNYYLLHFPLMSLVWLFLWLLGRLVGIDLTSSEWAFGFAQLAVVALALPLCGEAVYRWVEQPMIRVGSRMARLLKGW